MSHAQYTLELATGELVTGPIHGSGGTLGSGQHERLQIQIDRANEGEPLGIYEPKPGHASVHVTVTCPECSGSGMDPDQVDAEIDEIECSECSGLGHETVRRAVDLRGAKIVHDRSRS